MTSGKFFVVVSSLLAVAGCGTIFNAREAQKAVKDKGEGICSDVASSKLDLADYSLHELVDFAMTNRPSMVAAALAVVDAHLALKEIEADAPLVSGTPWNSPHVGASLGYSESSLADHRLRSKTTGNASAGLSLDVLVYDFGRNQAQADAQVERLIAAGEYDFWAMLRDGEPVCYASLRSYALTRLSRKFKPAHGGVKKVTFKGAMINASEIAGAKMLYPKVDHTPKPHRKSFYDGFFAVNPDCIIRNIRFRFRDSRQYLPDLLEYSGKRKNLARVKPSKVLFYIIPKNKPGYVRRKLDGLRKKNGIKFICNNTISRGTPEDRRLISDYVSDILNP